MSASDMEVKPLLSFEEVKRWTAPNLPRRPIPLLTPSLTYARVKASNEECPESGKEFGTRVSIEKGKTPLTLLCHDMMGGYLDDRYIDGIEVSTLPYYFVHWSGIDVFVYFSHNFVTIPPIGWIESAHKNGVKVLGTIITEWESGTDLCEQFLSSDESVDLLVSKCVAICNCFSFEGWLVNIENDLTLDQVSRMIQFLTRLTCEMRKLNPNSKVIWYDSVTKDGKLDWQNELNENNAPFFETCDGIFLNYTWSEDHLRSSKSHLNRNESISEELDWSHRAHDIFVGIDVFGRGCFGGGGFNTKQALEQARSNQFSVAIFAPGWTYETIDKTLMSCQGDMEQLFIHREFLFWKLLESSLFYRGLKLSNEPDSELLHPSSNAHSLLFNTSFKTGCKKIQEATEDGTLKTKWHFNLSNQSSQCSFLCSDLPQQGHCELSKIFDEFRLQTANPAELFVNPLIGESLNIVRKSSLDTIVQMPLFVVDLKIGTGVQLNFIFNIKSASLITENTPTGDELLALRLVLGMAGSDQHVRLPPTSLSSSEFPCDLIFHVACCDTFHFEEINLIGIEIGKEIAFIEVSNFEIHFTSTCG